MMPDWDRQRLGRCGEIIAAGAYEALGYDCVARRWRTARGEIDLVLRRGDVLVFCEVKTRRGDACGSPEESVTPARLHRLRTVAREFLAAQAVTGVGVYRFDVVAVEVDERRCGVRVRILQNVT